MTENFEASQPVQPSNSGSTAQNTPEHLTKLQYQMGGRIISVDANRILVGEGLHLECKFPVDKDSVAAQSVFQEAPGITFTVAQTTGWARLVAPIPECGPGAKLLAVRIVLSLEQEEVGRLSLRPVLAKGSYSQRRPPHVYGQTSVDLRPSQPGVNIIRGLFACSDEMNAKNLLLLVDLPKACKVTLFSVDLAWHDVESRSATKLGEPSTVSPFNISPLPATEFPAEMADPSPIVQKFDFKGFELTGHVVGLEPIKELSIAAERTVVDVQLRRQVELAEGLYLTCGFSTPILELIDPDASDLVLRIGQKPDRPFAVMELPEHLLNPLKASRGIRIRPKDLPPPTVSELFFFPDYSATNPYQRQMYRSMPNTVARFGTVQDAIARLKAGAPAGYVTLHLHWLNPLLAGAKTPTEAEQMRHRFTGLLRHFIRLGGIVLWTVHNTVSHDAQFHAAEVGLGQDVADLAHAVHVHSATLLPILAENYDLPSAKLVIQPHPNYVGTYTDYVGREAARNRFDLPQDARVILFIGQLRPYKGIEELARVFSKIAKDRPDCYLLIAGKPVHPYTPGMMALTLQQYRNVRVFEGFIPDSDLQWYYRAADWVALPYTSILTSGSLLCAMSFSRPVVAPQMGMIGDVVVNGQNGISYDPEAPDGLERALASAIETEAVPLARMQMAAFDAVYPLTWDKMGTALEAVCDRARKTRSITLPFEDRSLECLVLGKDFPPVAPARTAIVILNYEHVDDVKRLTDTLQQSVNQDFDIYIVDNASPGLHPSDLAIEFRNLHLLCLPENVGYAAGNNAALRMIADLPYEFVWILNPDMVVSAEALDQHVTAAANHPDHAIFGPVILRGTNQKHVASAGCYVNFSDGLETGHMYAGESCDIIPTAPFEADFITGASVFLRKSALASIGLIPEDYFLYFEETHWLLNASKLGMKSLVLPHVRLAHYKRSEEDGLPAKYYFYYYLRNALLFYARMTGRDPAILRDKLAAGFMAAWLKKIEARRPAALETYRHLAERALADGLAGRSGRVDLFELELSQHAPAELPPESEVLHSFSVTQDGLVSGLICIIGSVLPSVMVSIIANGTLVGNVPAKLSDVTNGIQQWSVSSKLPASCHRDKSVAIEFRLNGRGLPGEAISEFLPRLQPDYKARIDGITDFVCRGWALDQNSPDQKVTVEILYEGEVVARTIADQYRDDLLRSGLGDGAVAFEVRMPRLFSDGRKRKIALQIAGTDIVLFERDVVDSKIAGGALPQPARKVMDDLFYDRHIWLARHELEELPLGKHDYLSRGALSTLYANRPESELVSVIMPAFNRADSILTSLESVRAQSYRNWELLVIDDGSADTTVEVVRDYIAATGDDRIRLIILPENAGVSAARNAGLRQSNGEIIAYLDSDNVWLPDFLLIMSGELMRQPLPGSAYCGQRIVQVCGLPEARKEELIAIRMAPFHLPLIENRNYIDLNCFVHHRRLYSAHGGFAEQIRRLVDWEIILRYARVETPLFVPVLLSNYFFDKSANQITKLESYDDNMRAFTMLAKRHKKRAIPDVTARSLDIALVAMRGQTVAMLAQRAEEIATALGTGMNLRFLLCPAQVSSDLAETSIANGVEVLLPDGNDAAKLSAILAARREDADLLLMDAAAIPQAGWLAHFNAAIADCAEGGIFVSRHMILGSRLPAHAKAVPFAQSARDVCIALPADRRVLTDPALNPSLNLAELSEAGLFCTYIVKDCAAVLCPDPNNSAKLNDQLLEMSEVVRTTLSRKIVYCGNVEVYEL